jgi:predicted nucleotidyltransferase
MKLLNLRSKVRRKLLALYFSNPDKKYYVNQLGRIIGEPAGNVRNEMVNLVSGGLFEREHVGNLVMYSLNTRHAMYNELYGLIKKSIGVEGSLREALSTLTGIETAFIFGSFAQNSEHDSSDVDLFIVGEPDREALRKAIYEQEKALGRQINHHLYSPADWNASKRRSAGFILNIMENARIFLIGDEQCL